MNTAILSPQDRTDEQVVNLWINSTRSQATRSAYSYEWQKIRAYWFPKGIRAVTLEDVQELHAYCLGTMSAHAANRRLAAAKSLLSFAHKIGYTIFNVGVATQAAPVQDTLSERILTKEEVAKVSGAAGNTRDSTLIAVLYYSAARVGEIVNLKWKDVVRRSDGSAQLALYGKGGKTRHVLLPLRISEQLLAMRGASMPHRPVFVGSNGKGMSARRIEQVVEACGHRALGKQIGPHWFRHSHITHAIEAGAKLPLVMATAGHASLAVTSRYTHVRPWESSGSYLEETLV